MLTNFRNFSIFHVISQGSVATRLRCGGQCDSQFVANFLVNSTMKNLKIRQHMPKLWAKV